jgi:hypothetical protein
VIKNLSGVIAEHCRVIKNRYGVIANHCGGLADRNGVVGEGKLWVDEAAEPVYSEQWEEFRREMLAKEVRCW